MKGDCLLGIGEGRSPFGSEGRSPFGISKNCQAIAKINIVYALINSGVSALFGKIAMLTMLRLLIITEQRETW